MQGVSGSNLARALHAGFIAASAKGKGAMAAPLCYSGLSGRRRRPHGDFGRLGGRRGGFLFGRRFFLVPVRQFDKAATNLMLGVGHALVQHGQHLLGIAVGAAADVGRLALGALEERHLAVWISPGDMARLVRCAVEAPHIHYEIVYGISNNTRRWWDLSHARQVLGYEPQDDAEVYAAELLRGPSEAWAERVRYIGGSKCEMPFMA